MKTILVILTLLIGFTGGGFLLFRTPLAMFVGLFIALLLMPACLKVVNKQTYNGNTGYGESTDLQVKDEELISRAGRF